MNALGRFMVAGDLISLLQKWEKAFGLTSAEFLVCLEEAESSAKQHGYWPSIEGYIRRTKTARTNRLNGFLKELFDKLYPED